MTAAFDITAYEADIAEMRRVQDELDAEARPRQEALAEALFLLAIVDDMRAHRFKTLQRAETRLENALRAVFQARDALDAASDLEIEAMRAVSLLRGELPGAVERAMSTLLVNL